VVLLLVSGTGQGACLIAVSCGGFWSPSGWASLVLMSKILTSVLRWGGLWLSTVSSVVAGGTATKDIILAVGGGAGVWQNKSCESLSDSSWSTKSLSSVNDFGRICVCIIGCA